MNVNLFGNKVFADNQSKMRSLGWALANITDVLIKRRNLGTEKKQGWGESQVKTQEIILMKECLRLSETRARNRKQILSYRPKQEPALSTVFLTSSLQNFESMYFCWFSHPVRGILLWQPQEIHILLKKYLRIRTNQNAIKVQNFVLWDVRIF